MKQNGNTSSSVDCTLDKETYPKGGHAGITGPLYEIDVAQIFFLESLVSLEPFKLFVNFNEPKGQKFDDVVHLNLHKKSYCMIQTKYRDADTPVSLQELTADTGPFSLVTYFSSFVKIESSPPEHLKEAKVENVILFSNRSLDEKAESMFVEFKEQGAMFDYQQSDCPPSRPALFYHLTNDGIEKMKKSLLEDKMGKLAEDLLDWLVDGKVIRFHQPPWDEPFEYLAENIFQFQKNSIKMRDPVDQESKHFLKILEDKFDKKNGWQQQIPTHWLNALKKRSLIHLKN